jgi:DNA-binding NtrC family response regulator
MHTTIQSVLIVEDELPVANLVRAVLSPDYSCSLASSVAEALQQLRTRSFELVLVDEGLPDGSGLYLLQIILTIAPQTAVIVMSGQTDEQSVAAAKKTGAVNFIGKPFNLIHLREVVEAALAQRADNAA